MDWIMGASTYSNYALEAAMVSHWNLAVLLHAPLSTLQTSLKENILIRDTIFAWREVRKKLHLPVTLSQYTPFMNNPNFPHGQDYGQQRG